ncbi:hypothetical protein GCM10023205_10490 [Yinghuangia aomiensis]|uniref:Histidine kinase/HSP90-like ATPase domain-containing protein n=1 Tax=Yinghuangia aomiensis TaxID=676205 RepID=A0ABP9GSX4_9ACTN
MHATESFSARQVLARCVFPPRPHVVRYARAVIGGIAAEHGFDTYVLATVASELVTNAVRHAGGGGAVELWVSIDPEHVCVAVVDQMPLLVLDLSSVGLPDDDAESGRGLAILVGVFGAVLESRTIRGGVAKVVLAKLAHGPLRPADIADSTMRPSGQSAD